MIFGCQDHVNVLGRKITGVLHKNLSKDMPSSSPTFDIDGSLMFLSPMTPMTKCVDATLKEYMNSEDGEVIKILEIYEQAHGWLQDQRRFTFGNVLVDSDSDSDSDSPPIWR